MCRVILSKVLDYISHQLTLIVLVCKLSYYQLGINGRRVAYGWDVTHLTIYPPPPHTMAPVKNFVSRLKEITHLMHL